MASRRSFPRTARRASVPAMRALILLAPLLLAACAGYVTPERTVLWTPYETYTREAAPPAP
jgi:hypothetical protein